MRAPTLVLCVTLTATGPAAAASNWVEVTGPHFLVFTNAGDGAGRRTAWQFEQIRSGLSRLWPGAKIEAGRPFIVFAVKDEPTLRTLGPQYWEGKRFRPVAFSASGRDRQFVALRTDVREPDDISANPYQTAYWSYASAVFTNAFPRRLPTWYSRGIAEVVSNTFVREKELHVGRILFTHLAAAQAVLEKEGRVSMAELAALCKDCPIEDMVNQISEVLPGANVMAIQQVVKGRMETIGHFQNFSYGVSALVLLVGCLMVFVTMMGSVCERTVEIGIFRAMGFRNSHVIRIVLLEAGMIAAVAGIVGYFAGLGATRALLPLFTEGHGHGAVSFDPVMAGSAFLASIILGITASLYPALIASRLDPNEALRAL